MDNILQVLPRKYNSVLKALFQNDDDYYRTRDKFLKNLQPDLDRINEKRRKSEEIAQTKYYR